MKNSLAIVAAFSLASCAEWNSIHRTTALFERDEAVTAQSISIDAKQRFLLAGEREKLIRDKEGNIMGRMMTPIYCSEPSPDVFSVFSAALEANAGKGEELTAALKLATSETGATIGIRTQSIQLLRDAMYRICEAYLAGGIEEFDYYELLTRYQKSMVTLIAVEQLTGAARPGQVVLESGATVNASSAVYEAKRALTKARDDHDKTAAAKKAAEDEVTTAEGALGGTFADKCEGAGKPAAADKENCEAVTAAKEEVTKKENELSLAKREMDEWQQVFNKIENATSLSANGEGQVIPAVGAQMDAATVASLADSVRKLVRDVFMDDFIKTCLETINNDGNRGVSQVDDSQTSKRISEAIEDNRARLDDTNDRILDISDLVDRFTGDLARAEAEARNISSTSARYPELQQQIARLQSAITTGLDELERRQRDYERISVNLERLEGQLILDASVVNQIGTTNAAAMNVCDELILKWIEDIGGQEQKVVAAGG